jgi:radical SAM superfamily enzyme YgiQ (UPF0313 family)
MAQALFLPVKLMKKDVPHILLINPWIDDFAAYDFWAKPMGILSIAAILRDQGYNITYIDALDRFVTRSSTLGSTTMSKRFGRGAYSKISLPRPAKLKDVPRNYSRYGIPKERFRELIKKWPKPDAVLVTSMMTYWYPGVFAVIRIVRNIFPYTPIILGGIYPTLCHKHAMQYSGADYILSGPGEAVSLKLLNRLTGHSSPQHFSDDNLDTYPYPAFELQTHIPYVPILTSRGCPFRCTYCASGLLNPKVMRRRPEGVIDEILYWHKRYGIRDFPFYDDALLIDAESHIIPILEGIIRHRIDVRFHTPNALHVREISKDLARLLYRAGFKTILLGLETADFHNRRTLDNKVASGEFERAILNLKEAGFFSKEIGAYLLFGLPAQSLSDLEASIDLVKRYGVRPILAEYSPIPNTPLWKEAVKVSRYDLESDPIFHNNSVFPCWKKGFSWEKIRYFKQLARKPIPQSGVV